VNNVNVGRLRKSKVYLYRRKIGVVFQDYRLLPEKTVFENVAYALEVLDLPNDKIRKRTREVLKLVDLADKANVKPRELSGGQQQRVAIARAIAKRPAILIADEPTGNLDPAMTDEMITLLEKINKEEKTTLLVVTHNDVMVEFHPKRTIRIQSGHVVDDGMRAAAYASKMKATDKPNRGETMTKEERIQALREAEEADKNYVHKPHVLSESDAQEAKFNEITMQLDAIKEISEGGEE
ncbi:MAG: ATP-binding cassette domain-containing protein, partial [Erysipelotrichaceae bacterium]|nr:ATP-binding cassette domain-containing protein [Erysipelotrichaceae bacterium]